MQPQVHYDKNQDMFYVNLGAESYRFTREAMMEFMLEIENSVSCERRLC